MLDEAYEGYEHDRHGNRTRILRRGMIFTPVHRLLCLNSLSIVSDLELPAGACNTLFQCRIAEFVEDLTRRPEVDRSRRLEESYIVVHVPMNSRSPSRPPVMREQPRSFSTPSFNILMHLLIDQISTSMILDQTSRPMPCLSLLCTLPLCLAVRNLPDINLDIVRCNVKVLPILQLRANTNSEVLPII